MTQPSPNVPDRSYGCSFGCGNPYDFVFVSVRDGTTELLCLPCMIQLATQMVESIQNPDSPIVAAAISAFPSDSLVKVSSPGVKPRGRNAPATTDDPDVIEAFAEMITEDELPDAFR
jgi:hypothetical protein